MKIAAGNAQHIGARQEQQDSFGFSDPGNETFVAHGGFLGLVADGMGGLSHGSEASQGAVRAFLNTYASKAADESIPDALARSLIAANQSVLALAHRLGSAAGTGTTLAAAVLHGDSLYWISAGDSRVYLCHSNSLVRVTADHVYANQLNAEVAEGRISPAEAQEHSERESLTSFLGDLKEVDRSLRPFALRKGDRVVVCSDGLYRALTPAEIIEAFRSDPQSACEELVEKAVAKQRKRQDNLTIIALAHGMAATARSNVPLRPAVAVLAAILLVAVMATGLYVRSWQKNRGRTVERPPLGAIPAAPKGAGTSSVNPPGKATSPAPPGSAPIAAPPIKHVGAISAQAGTSVKAKRAKIRRGSGDGKAVSHKTSRSRSGDSTVQGQASPDQPGPLGGAQPGSSGQPPTSFQQPPAGSGNLPGGQGATAGQAVPENGGSGSTPPAPAPDTGADTKTAPETAPNPTPPPNPPGVPPRRASVQIWDEQGRSWRAS